MSNSSLASFWVSWQYRVGVVLFLYLWGQWGFYPALMAAVMIAFACRLWKKRQSPAARNTTRGSADWAGLSALIRTDNVTLDLDSTRFLLGVTKQPMEIRRNQFAVLTISGNRFWNRPLAYPLVVTGTKDALLGHPDDGHCLCLAGSGAGKGVAVVQPNLCIYAGSTVTLDPKGENFLRTHTARLHHGNRVCLIDPFKTIDPRLHAQYGIRFNPLQPLEEYALSGQHAEVYDEAGGIAEMMVLTTGKEMQPHFLEKAKAIIRSAILFATYADCCQDRSRYPLNLVTVKDVIDHWFLDREKHKILMGICSRNPHLRSISSTVTAMAVEEFMSVMSTVLTQTDFLNSHYVRESLSASDIRLSDLKQDKLSLYLVLPANQLKTYDPLARLWIGTLLRGMMHTATPPRHRVLFMLDEIGQLGKLDPLLQAISLGRGYGIDVYMIFQDMAQMQAAYGDSFRSLFANAKYQQFFGIRDLTTAKEVSELLGKATIETVSHASSKSVTWGRNTGYSSGVGSESNSNGRNRSETVQNTATHDHIERLLLTPDEVLTLPETDLLILMAGKRPVRALKFDTRLPFFRNAVQSFAGQNALLEAPDNNYVEAPLLKPKRLQIFG